MKKGFSIFMVAALLSVLLIPTVKPVYGAITAAPTSSKLLIGAKVWQFDAYNIGGYNYFKLRDLAYVLNGTPKHFSVNWDESKKAITLTRDEEYKPTGEEISLKGSGNKSASPSTASVYVGGTKLAMEAYNIDGYNYFKLRDLGNSSALNFIVNWYEDTNSIVILTAAGGNPQPEYLLYAGKPGVLKKDSKLLQPYAITVDTDGNDIVEKYENFDRTLMKGEIVVVTKDENGQSRIMLPGDPPALRGYINTTDISFNAKDVDSAIKLTGWPYSLDSYKVVLDIYQP